MLIALANMLFSFGLVYADSVRCSTDLISPRASVTTLDRRLIHPRKRIRLLLGGGDEAKVFAVACRTRDGVKAHVDKIFRAIDDESGSEGALTNARALMALKEMELDGTLGDLRVLRVRAVCGATLTLDLVEGEEFGYLVYHGLASYGLRLRYHKILLEAARRLTRLGTRVEVLGAENDVSEGSLSVYFRLPVALSQKFYARPRSPEIEFASSNIVYAPGPDQFFVIDPF